MQQHLFLVLSFLFILQGCGGDGAPAPQGAAAAPGATTQPPAGQEKQGGKTEEPTTGSKSGEGLNKLPKKGSAAEIISRLRVNELTPAHFQQSVAETTRDIFKGIVNVRDEISIESQSDSGEFVLYSFAKRDYKTGKKENVGKRVILNTKTGEQKELPFNGEQHAFLSSNGKFFTCVKFSETEPTETSSYDLASGALIAKHAHDVKGTYWNVRKSTTADRILMYSGSRLYSVDMNNLAASEFIIDDSDNIKMETITVNSAANQVLYFSWRNNATPFHRLFDLDKKTHSDTKDLFTGVVDFNDKYVIFRENGLYSYALRTNLLNGNTEKTTINLAFPSPLVGGVNENNEFIVFDGNSYIEYDLDKNAVKKSFFPGTKRNTAYSQLFSIEGKRIFVSKIESSRTDFKEDSTGLVNYQQAKISMIDLTSLTKQP